MDTKLLILVVVLLAVILGGLVWYLWHGKEPVSPPLPSPTPLPEQKEPTPEAKREAPSVAKDCGEGEFDQNAPLSNTVLCLGESLLSNCTNAKAMINHSHLGPIEAEIKGENIEQCRFRLQFAEGEKIPNEQLRQFFANSWIECPIKNFVNSLKLEDPETREPLIFEKMLEKGEGGRLMAIIFMFAPMLAFDPNAATSGCVQERL